MIQSLLPISCLAALLLAASNLLAQKNYLPERMTPVPAGEQVPALDFLRPHLFESPTLNPAGTHFAAFTKNSALGDSVMICEIGTGKVSYTKGGIASVVWISNQHLLLSGYIVVDIADV